MGKIKTAACVTNRTVIRLYGDQEKRFLNKLIFVRRNVFPYFHAKKIYAALFIICYLLLRS